MRKTLLLPALLITLLACDNSTDQDFKNIAKDTCDCVNILADDLSPGMIKLISESDGDEAKLEQGMMDLMLEDQETTMNDVNILQGNAAVEMESCMAKVEKKYDDVYTTLSENEVLEKIMVELKTMNGCESTVAIIKMGMAAQGK